MIINLRGANGSGKSTVAFDLMHKFLDQKEIMLASYLTPGGAKRFVTGYHLLNANLVIVGSYNTACGGCDGIKTQELIKKSVMEAAFISKHVFFEGVIVSTLFSGYLDLSRVLENKGGMTWAYLDTPLETCLARIQKRNGGKPINEQLVADKVRSIESTRRKAEAAGERVVTIRHKKALEDVLELLK